MLLARRLSVLGRLKGSDVTTVRGAASEQEDRSEPEVFRELTDGRIHVTSVNALTKERSVVEVSAPAHVKNIRFSREAILPDAAVAGLRRAVVDLARPPKQIQHEADQMRERLDQRKFPAPPHVIREARRKIREQLKGREDEDEEDAIIGEELSQKVREAREYQLRNKVDKLLRRSHYNWKPLETESREAAAAYALARLVPNYAEVSRALDELSRVPDWRPASVLDYGSGCGAVFWAVDKRFGSSVKEYTLVDTNDHMTQFAMDVMRGESTSATSPLVHKGVHFRRHLLPSAQTTYDLVVAQRALIEIGSHETRLSLLDSLWQRTDRFLVLIESAMDDSFGALMEARDYLLTKGWELHKQETETLMKDHACWSPDAAGILSDRRLGDYERYELIRGLLPAGVSLPTAHPSASVFAPCPHDMGCPMHKHQSCTFPVRWRVLRADGKRTAREADGTETGRMSMLVMEKARRGETGAAHQPPARIIKNRKLSGHATCDVCTAYRGLQRVTLSKRAGQLYQKLKAKRDGELLPLEMRSVATEGVFDVYEQGTRGEEKEEEK